MFQFIFRRPITSLALSFAIVILIGSCLLKLPGVSSGGVPFLDALFTATSATCVTGLTVVDIGTNFSFWGQLIILFLIQAGGLGIMTGAAFVFLIFKRVGIRAGAGFKTILEEDYISDLKKSIKFIIISTFLLETIGAIFLFARWQGFFSNTAGLVFNSVFHSISAFCNAGFSLFRNSFEDFRGDIFTNLIICALIIFGGIGFFVLEDIYRKITSFLKRQKFHFSLHSKIVLISTILIIFFGATFFYIFEKENFAFLSQKEFISVSFFQSVTARTAGFNTVDIENLSNPTIFLLIFLMFVGAAPASTAGGIKVTSLALIILAIISFFKREEEVVVFGRIIPRYKFKIVFVLVSVYLMFCLVISILLLYIEKDSFERILFEVFSAMGTVGLSTGITPNLTDLGKILIIITMFVGRLLPLSLAIIGSRELVKAKIIYPEEKIILG